MQDTRYEIGSALILAVVLTSLLAIVGVMFVMVARVDRMATSSIAENKELNSAVETVIARLSQVLALDVPHNDPCRTAQEYYDYPDTGNPWLASLEPYELGGDYYWRQISDVTGYLADPNHNYSRTNIRAYIVGDHEAIYDSNEPNQIADADGDGVADSKWIELQDITTGKGRPIYAAIRIIDNGGMLNLSTVFADPGGSDERKGDKLTDIYIDGLVKTGTNYIDKFIANRSGDSTITKAAAEQYHNEVSRRIENPAMTDPAYTLYDISDELSLRNRFVVYNRPTITRLESQDCFGNSLRNNNAWTPVDDSDSFKKWKRRMDPNHPDNNDLDPNQSDNLYAFRKLLTTYNMDRIINPAGDKMLCINDSDPNVSFIYNALRAGLYDGGMADPNSLAAQMAVNLKDFRDNDSNVATISVEGNRYYGFEAQPFITEIGMKVIFGPPNYIHYALELYNPFSQPIGLEDFVLELNCGSESRVVSFDPGDIIDANSCFVIASDLTAFGVVDKQDPNLSFFGTWKPPDLGLPRPAGPPPYLPPFSPVADANLLLKRDVGDPNIYIDRQVVDRSIVDLDCLLGDCTRYFGRDVRDWHIVYQTLEASASSLGIINNIDPALFTGHNFSFFLPNPLDPNREFITVGDIPRILKIGHGVEPNSTIGEQLGRWGTNEEYEVRLDLQDPNHRNVFQYLTVFDPANDGINNDGDVIPNDGNDLIDEDNLDGTPEWKIPGRININTAPWYVIAQLPWVSGELAQAIVAYRDRAVVVDNNDIDYTSRPGEPGLRSIGELNQVVGSNPDYSIDYYALDSNDLGVFPDLTPNDGLGYDFEERDVIFSRLSNLVTVRSDVFTAYILVRIDTDGPQKRVVAILDRSDVYPAAGRVKVRALHPVPDPR